MEGPHKVTVKFGGTDVPKSPFKVQVEGVAGDSSKVTASGPGLRPDGMLSFKLFLIKFLLSLYRF